MAQEYLLLETGDHLLLETGDDTLLESSVVDQTVTLPLIDDASISGPSLTLQGVLDLPLIDDSTVLAPTLTGTVTITLPLLDDSQAFGPQVTAEYDVALPLLDDSTIFGPSISIDLSLNLPLIDGGWPFAPTIDQGVTGLAVTLGATDLDESFARTWLDELTGPGSWGLSLANDDADMPLFDQVLVFSLDGQARYAGVVEKKHVTTFSPGEAVDGVTALSGRGRIAVLDRGLVRPSRGIEAEPVETVRTFSWVSPDFPDAGWPNSKQIRRSDRRTARTPFRYSPEWWPDKASWWIWADRPDVDELDAPGGRCYFRDSFTVPEDGTIELLVGLDNFGSVYLDGARVIDTENDPSSYTIGNRVRVPVTAGTHYIAANVLNTGRGGGFNFTVWTIDEEGLLDTLITHSDYTTKCLGYPASVPGFTFGMLLRLALEQVQDDDDELLDVTLGFTDNLDSDGEPWTNVVEVTCEVGRSFLEFVLAVSDWLIDVQMAPGANVLRAWNWGTRGGTPGVTIAATSNPATSEVEALDHDGRHIRANALLIKFRRGFTEVVDQDSIDADGRRSAFVDLGHVDSETLAQGIGTRLLGLRKDPSYAHRLTLAPVGNVPYQAFDNGDTITHPNESGTTSASRVRSIAFSQDDNNAAETWSLELHDVRQEIEERQDNWLKRTGMGNLAGGAQVTTRSGEQLPSAVRISTTNVAEFSFDGPLVASSSMDRPADSSGNLIEIYAKLTTAGSTSTTIRVFLNGVQVGADVVFAAGEDTVEVDLSAAKVFRNIDVLQTEIVTAGTDAEGLDLQVRAI